jgi:glyoxylase-like metal-dependent hydrolase (beta-lactamase superfamily II)
MLKKVAEGVLVHQSECLQSNAVVVQGKAGVLLIDPGLTADELISIADDLHKLGKPVVVGFSTHSHWDHVLWHAKLGKVPRYGTARCAADIKAYLSNPNWKTDIVEELPPEIADDVPRDLLGLITGLPDKATHIPWDGPTVRIIEHNAHAPGHAALFIEDSKILIVGDMLSDVLIPMLNFAAADPIKDYLAGLKLIESVADDVDLFIPGHGSVGNAEDLRSRIKLDREYVQTLQDGKDPKGDPRISSPKKGWEWVADMHNGQAQGFTQKSKHDEKSK